MGLAQHVVAPQALLDVAVLPDSDSQAVEGAVLELAFEPLAAGQRQLDARCGIGVSYFLRGGPGAPRRGQGRSDNARCAKVAARRVENGIQATTASFPIGAMGKDIDDSK